MDGVGCKAGLRTMAWPSAAKKGKTIQMLPL